MSGSILDTNVVSELTRQAPNPRVSTYISRHDDLWLASVVVYELEFGLELLPHGRRRDALALSQRRVTRAFDGRVLPLTETGAEWAARFMANAQRHGRPIQLADALIAGTAMANDFAVITRNVRDFEGLGVEIIDPWRAELD